MSIDPLSAIRTAAGTLAIVDKATGGAIRETVEHLVPDANAILRREIGRASDELMVAVEQVVRVLIAKAYGVEPTDRLVSEFINGAAADPAFAARTTRLLSQAVRTPHARRRRMLALALFSPHPDAPTRDEVDSALEVLEPIDVELLRELNARDGPREGFKVGQAIPRIDPNSTDPIYKASRPSTYSIGRTRTLLLVAGEDWTKPIACPVSSAMRLLSAHCIDMTAPPTSLEIRGEVLVIRLLNILPIAVDLLSVLRDERAVADIDASASPQSPDGVRR